MDSGIRQTGIDPLAMFQISKAPFGSNIVIPNWLQCWGFKHEFEALLASSLYVSMALTKNNRQIEANTFEMVFRATTRLASLDSEWAG